MIKLGVTGGIGSGKSTVSELFKICGIPVYIADTESKKLLNTSVLIRQGLIGLFGEELYESGRLDKALLASFIFNNEENLKQVNSIIHPEVALDFAKWVKQNEDCHIIVLESAILFESGFSRYVDRILTVYAPCDMRIRRVMDRDNCVKEKVLERMLNQMPDEEKIKLSDFIITNDEIHSVLSQSLDVLKQLGKK